VALDDSLAEGHLMLGLVRMHERDYSAAEEHFRRAIELDPSHSLGHEALAGLYLVTGRPAEGLAEAERALELDPLAASAAAEVARALLFNGRCDEALSQLERIAAVQPPPLRAAPIAAQCYARDRRWADAIDVLRPQAERDVVARALSGYLHGRAGHREEALRIQAGLLERWRPRQEGAVHVAVTYAGLGDLDQAFAWLDRAVDDGSLALYPWYGHILEPIFQRLHRDPRFETLKVRLGLEKQ
jgi:tetratricopeptide (TPR) repeat protein